MDERYQRIDYPGASGIYNVVIPGWLLTPTTLQPRSDDKDAITIHVPKIVGLQWSVEASNGTLTLRPAQSSMQPNPHEASTLALIVRVPLGNMSDRRTFSLSRNEHR